MSGVLNAARRPGRAGMQAGDPDARKAMEGVRRRRRGDKRRVEEACVMNWLMRDGGYVWGMEFLEAVM